MPAPRRGGIQACWAPRAHLATPCSSLAASRPGLRQRLSWRTWQAGMYTTTHATSTHTLPGLQKLDRASGQVLDLYAFSLSSYLTIHHAGQPLSPSRLPYKRPLLHTLSLSRSPNPTRALCGALAYCTPGPHSNGRLYSDFHHACGSNGQIWSN